MDAASVLGKRPADGLLPSRTDDVEHQADTQDFLALGLKPGAPGTPAGHGQELSPTNPVTSPSEGTLLEAKLCQSMRAMLSEALGPLTKEVNWLRHNAITSAELEERLEARDMEEDPTEEGAAGAAAFSDAELIDATAR